MRSTMRWAVLLGAVALSGEARQASAADVGHEVKAEKDVMVPMRDGVKLATDVYLPASSNFPRFDVNPNTGEPADDYRRKVTATNTVYHDKMHPSHIILPVIPIAR